MNNPSKNLFYDRPINSAQFVLTHDVVEQFFGIMPGVGEAADQLQLDAALGVAQGELLDALHHGADGLVGAGAVEVGEGHGARTWTKKFGVS